MAIQPAALNEQNQPPVRCTLKVRVNLVPPNNRLIGKFRSKGTFRRHTNVGCLIPENAASGVAGVVISESECILVGLGVSGTTENGVTGASSGGSVARATDEHPLPILNYL